MALVVQKLGKPQGNFNPTLYRMAATTSLSVFHDTTPASSGVAILLHRHGEHVQQQHTGAERR